MRGIKYQWDDSKREIVRVMYDGTDRSVSLIAARLNLNDARTCVNVQIVKNEIYRQGLENKRVYARGGSRMIWTHQEDELLHELTPRYAPATIQKKMNRTIPAIISRQKVLGLHRRYYRDGWYTADDVAKGLGRDLKWVTSRIQANDLKATKHNGHLWHIDRDDLRKYVLNNLHYLTGRNVDLFFFTDLILPNGIIYGNNIGKETRYDP